MPELPEVETIRRGLEKIMVGHVFRDVEVRRPDLRIEIPKTLKKTLTGRACKALVRRGKYIVCVLDNDAGFVLHLGMSGRVHIIGAGEAYEPAKHDHIIFRMENGSAIAFNDARRFGMVFLLERADWERQKPFDSMGPEPLEDEFTPEALLAAFKNRKGPIKTALLDQGAVSGIGNIYASEALYLAGIRPDLPAGALKRASAVRLVESIRVVLEKAIAAGGSTLKDYRHADGNLGYFQHQFSVYDRAGLACPGCNCDVQKTGGIVKTVQAGRSTFHCPRKQI